jgi:hypothetical protein
MMPLQSDLFVMNGTSFSRAKDSGDDPSASISEQRHFSMPEGAGENEQ